MFKFVNLTPHEVRMFNQGGEAIASFPPSGIVARVSKDKVFQCQAVNYPGASAGIPIYQESTVGVSGVPVPDGCCEAWFIVDESVAKALPGRRDILYPGDAIVHSRDERCSVIGCTYLAQSITR